MPRIDGHLRRATSSSATSPRASCAAIGSASSARTAPARRRCLLLIGELEPDGGKSVRTRLQLAYFDQQRQQLDPEASVLDNVAAGTIPSRQRPAPAMSPAISATSCSPPERIHSPVKVAVGRRAQPPAAGPPVHPACQHAGARRADQRPRCRNARTARRAAGGIPGTLLLVSHDRAFLDNVVTSALVPFEGGGRGERIRWRLQRLGAPARGRRAAKSPAVGGEAGENATGQDSCRQAGQACLQGTA